MTSTTAMNQVQSSHATVAEESTAFALAEEQQYRAGVYRLLAALLGGEPDQALLDRVAELADTADVRNELGLTMSMLGLAAHKSSRQAVDDEYHDLFIGLGRGELMPYASWYLTGFLMEAPLGALRTDLVRLGFERDPEVHEPEDHIAALCEVMAMMIQEDLSFDDQARFFGAHLAPWCSQFCADLSNAGSAVFYRNLGRFGSVFFELEQRYFSMHV